MPQINQLPLESNLSTSDNIVLWSSFNGDTRRSSLGNLLQFFQKNFVSPTIATTIILPINGFNIAVPTPVAQEQWLLLQPASTLTSGSITLPLNTQTPDGTEVLITTTLAITAFSLIRNGASAQYGTPSTLGVGDFFRTRFVVATNSWYRIG